MPNEVWLTTMTESVFFHPYTQKSYTVCKLINEEGLGWTMEVRRVAVDPASRVGTSMAVG